MASHCDKNLTSMQLSASQMTDPVLLRSKGIVSASFAWVMWHEAIPYSVILFWIKMMKPAVVSYHDAVQKVVALDSIPFQQL